MAVRGLIARARRDERGSVAILAAASLGVVLACAALAVDLGSIYLQSRKLQGMADLAAMAAARDLASAQAAAVATVDLNKLGSPVSSTVVTGRYDANPGKAQSARFTGGAASPNAVRVELAADADLFFGQAILGKSKVPIRRQAIATRAEFASFSIGARLASLDGGIANALLTSLTGSKVSLSVMDYNALAGVDLDLLAYTSALRTKLSMEGASFDKVLAANLTTGKALSVASEVLAAAGKVQAAAALNKIAVSASTLGPAKLDALIDLGPIGAQDKVVSVNATKVEVSALELVNAMLLAANQNRQVQLDLGAGVPGVADLTVFLGIGERPNNSAWLTLNDANEAVVRTNQARLYIRAEALGVLGVLGAKPVTLPLLVELASGEAKLAAIDCPAAAASNRVMLDVRPSVGSIAIADINTSKLNDFKSELVTSPGTIVSLPPLLTVTGEADIQLGGQTWNRVEFTQADIDSGSIKSVKTSDIAKATLSSLISNTDLTVKLIGLPLSLDLSILSALNGLAAPLDGVLNTLTALLGVRLGEADVRVHGLRCRDAVLVA
jgi:uncharacterized membrane protein